MQPQWPDLGLDLPGIASLQRTTYPDAMSVRKIAISFRNFLNHPGKVTALCLVFFATTLILNGLLWRLWGLHRDYERLTAEISETEGAIEKLNAQLRQAKDPSFIERQARDKLDLVSEKDLVFVFPEQ